MSARINSGNLYGTTKDFLNYIGVDDLSDLPKPREIEEIMGKLDASEAVADNILEALTAGEEDVDGEDDASAELVAGNGSTQALNEDGANQTK